MKRRAARVVVFLLLGAIVNVAVAWGCVANAHNRPMEFTLLRGIPDDWLQSAPTEFTRSLKYTLQTRQMGYVAIMFWDGGRLTPGTSTNFINESATMVSAGWPYDALVGCRWQRKGDTGLLFHRDEWLLPFTSTVPLRPVWPEFAINMIFYAAVLWLVFAFPFVVRRYFRRRRIKRGLCPACAYPVGTSPVCTECGAALPTVQPRRGRSPFQDARLNVHPRRTSNDPQTTIQHPRRTQVAGMRREV